MSGKDAVIHSRRSVLPRACHAMRYSSYRVTVGAKHRTMRSIEQYRTVSVAPSLNRKSRDEMRAQGEQNRTLAFGISSGAGSEHLGRFLTGSVRPDRRQRRESGARKVSRGDLDPWYAGPFKFCRVP